jgi:acyl-CoA synthetase (NDP forming)
MPAISLDCLLRPSSIAVVGATRRAGAVGNTVIRNLLAGGYAGRLAAVNPGYDSVEGVPCHPSLADVPFRPEQVIFAVADERIEPALADAVRAGMRSCVIYSALVLADDGMPPLVERVRRMLREAGVAACGGNGMGYYNFTHGIWACGFETRHHRRGGNVVLISQSGAGMSGILDVEERLDFSLAVSPGQELTVTLENYLDYALDQPETRVVGLFMETSRAPLRFLAALEKARARGIPVVAIKTGRTERAQELARSHSGALSGADAVYDAVFERHGVHRARDMAELATVLIMHAQPHAVGAGGLVTLHDSGGERQLLIDLAADEGVPLARLTVDSCRALASLLDPGLPAVNPLDAWSAGGPDYHKVMAECFAVLLRDPGAALGAVVHDRAPGGRLYPVYLDYLRHGHRASGKPVFLVAATQGIGADPAVLETTRAGFPVLDGVRTFLCGVRALLNHRDFLARPAPAPMRADEAIVSRWRQRFTSGPAPDEVDALLCLADFGVPVVPARRCRTEDEALAAATALGYPVALKTARAGVLHKSDAGGVRLGIGDAASLRSAYADLAQRFGPVVCVAAMVPDPAVEMFLGMRHDAQFGAVIIMGIGGIHAELLGDVVTLLPPCDAGTAMRLLDRLRLRRLLDGVRGAPAVDVPAFCRAAASFSMLAAALDGVVQEIDVNPVRVLPQGCAAVDALLIPAGQTGAQAPEPE